MDLGQEPPFSFGNVKYDQIAPYIYLSAEYECHGIPHLEVFRSRIPEAMCHDIVVDVDEALTQYGPLESHDNEETRSRFIAAVRSPFPSAVISVR